MAFPVVQSIATGSGNTSAVVSTPSGLAVGDLMIAYVSALSRAGDPSVNITTPTGWTLIGSSIVSSNEAYALFDKIATSGDVSAGTFTFPTAGDSAGVIVYRISGHNPTTPITVSNQGTHTASTTASATAITIPLPSLVLIIAGSVDGTNGGTAPSFSSFALASNNPTWTTDSSGNGGSNPSGHAFIGGAHANYTGAANSSTGTASATLNAARNNNLWVINIEPTPITPSIFGSTFGFLSFIINSTFIIGVLFGALFSVLVPVITTTTIWTRRQKSSDTWTTQNRSTL